MALFLGFASGVFAKRHIYYLVYISVMIMVAIASTGLIMCVLIIICGAVCLRRSALLALCNNNISLFTVLPLLITVVII